MDVARALVKEPDVATARAYRHRVRWLAFIYVALFSVSVTGICVVLWNGRLLVTLSQRSNVETLVIAFALLLFAYLGLAASGGALGALRIFAWSARSWFGGSAVDAERAKAAALRTAPRGTAAALNRVLELADRPGEAFEVRVADAAGPAGRLRVDGAAVWHLDAPGHGSNNLLAYFVRQAAEVMGMTSDDLDVVAWLNIDEEGWHQHVGLVAAFRALGRRTQGGTHLWPTAALSADQRDEVARRLSEVCAAVRDEGFLPTREFEGTHKIPIIPEPLGIVSLERRERRVDPLSSMASALVIVTFLVMLVIVFVVRPPWVPGG